MNENYSIDEIRKAFSSPTKSRIETIVELIEKAKRLKEEKA